MERTLIVLKPDAVQRRLTGEIIARFERKGLRIVAMKMLMLDESLARQVYAVHEGKEFYERLITFMICSPVVALVLEGNEAITIVRSMLGPTFGPDAPTGTIRGDFGISRRYNLVHGSDSAESAEYEIKVLFTPDEIQDYQLCDEPWVYDMTSDKII